MCKPELNGDVIDQIKDLIKPNVTNHDIKGVTLAVVLKLINSDLLSSSSAVSLENHLEDLGKYQRLILDHIAEIMGGEVEDETNNIINVDKEFGVPAPKPMPTK